MADSQAIVSSATTSSSSDSPNSNSEDAATQPHANRGGANLSLVCTDTTSRSTPPCTTVPVPAAAAATTAARSSASSALTPDTGSLSYGFSIQNGGRTLVVQTLRDAVVRLADVAATCARPRGLLNNSTSLSLRVLEAPKKNKESQQEDIHIKHYEGIEDWLCHIRVQDHNEVCTNIVTKPISDNKNKKEKLHHQDDESLITRTTVPNSRNTTGSHGAASTCAICCEDLFVGDIVSWSPNKACEHVFHHPCLMEWIKTHAKCPTCQEPFVPAKGFAQCRTPEDSLFCFLCLEHGLVQPAAVGSNRSKSAVAMGWENVDALNLKKKRKNPNRFALFGRQSTDLVVEKKKKIKTIKIFKSPLNQCSYCPCKISFATGFASLFSFVPLKAAVVTSPARQSGPPLQMSYL